jgi:hypothetical protein
MVAADTTATGVDAVKDQVWYGVSNAISPSSSLDDVYRF